MKLFIKKTIYLLFIGFISCNLDINAQDRTGRETAAKSLEQRQMMTKEFGLSDQQGIIIQKLSYRRSQQIDSLAHLGLPDEVFRNKREIVTDEYYMKVQEVLTEEQLRWFDINALKAARSNEIRALGLNPHVAIEMGRLKHAYTKQLCQLPEDRNERRVIKIELEEKYQQDIYNLIGKEKFEAWLNFKDTQLERKYINKYGFSKEQFNQYKELENRQAIEILKIKNTALPKDVKRVKIQDVKKQKVKRLQEFLSDEQFQKWYSDYLRAENNKQKNKQ